MNWRIYYSDGATFDSLQGEPEDAPKLGVEVILVRDGSKGRRVLKLQEFYVWSYRHNRWFDMPDSTAVILRALREPKIVVLSGEYLPEADFEQILIRAHNDADFPAVSVKSHPAWSE